MTVSRICRTIITTLLIAAAPAAPARSDRADTGQVQAQLIASVAAVHPGEDILLGVHQEIIPHWHTYWRNPGDSGVATTIEWTLPPGASAGDIQWPTPGRFRLGPVVNYGYADEVTLLSTVTIPNDARPGSRLPITAMVDWLVCREECIPQQVTLSLSLPIVAASQFAAPGSPLIEAAHHRLPIQPDFPIRANGDGKQLKLHIGIPNMNVADVQEVWFYPETWGTIPQSTEQTYRQTPEGIVLALQTGDAPPTAGSPLKGVVAVKTSAGTQGYLIDTPVATVTSPRHAEGADPGLLGALLMAMIGGLILNLMPCVFPVLSIKVLSVLKQAQGSPRHAGLQGIAYTVGVLGSFLLLAFALIVFKASGSEVGWGFQFQSPVFVLTMAYLIFAVGLNLSGVFSIGSSLSNVGSSLAGKSGFIGSFFTGMLATIVATPCTAPFMGVAIGYAVTQPPLVLLAICLSLGAGLALPFLLLSFWPAAMRRLPRPGPWMEHLRQFLAFPMYGSAVWLVWVLAQQAGIASIPVALGGMVLIAFAVWVYERSRLTKPRTSLAGKTGAAAILIAVMVGGSVAIEPAAEHGATSTGSAAEIWEPYSATRLQALRDAGKPVFLNFTAAWCFSCLVNERVTLSTAAVKTGLTRAGITYLKGDWTNRNREIHDILTSFGHSGVPLYVYYPPGTSSSPRILPQILTPDIMLDAITTKDSPEPPTPQPR